jgi:F-type H+-transporting ATPase subunit delta
VRDSVVIEGIVAPYAQALLSLGQAHGLTERFGEDAAWFLELLSASSDLSQLLESPIMALDVKRNVLRQVATDTVHPYMLNFVMLLVDRGRIPFLGKICEQYQDLLRQLNQSVLAEVTAAVALSDAQQEAIRQKVLEMTGARQVELSMKLDPELIGGVVIKVGSQIVDASLRGQLRRIGMALNSPV